MNIINIPEVGATPSGGVAGAFSSFFSTIKNRDFTILKWVLFGILLITPFVILILVVRGRIAGLNVNFGNGYGLKLITGTFGAGKTKYTFLKAFLWKLLNPHGILIANMPYNFVDFRFDSVKDFKFIIRDLSQYIKDTNTDEFLKEGFPPIMFICDEAHIYLFARDFKNFTKNSLIILTQCRKRELGIDFITQELGQIDVFIRRLCPYIQYYQELFRLSKKTIFVKESILYSKDVEQTTITSENGFEEVDYSFLLPFNWVVALRKKLLKKYSDQKFLTYYVVGSTDVYTDDTDIDDENVSHNYENFKQRLLDNRLLWLKDKNKKSVSFIDNLVYKLSEKRKSKFNDLKDEVEIKRQAYTLEVIKSYLGEERFYNILNSGKFNNYIPGDDVDRDIVKVQGDIILYFMDFLSSDDIRDMNIFYYIKEEKERRKKLEDKLNLLLSSGFTKHVEVYDDDGESFNFVYYLSPDGIMFQNYDFDTMIDYGKKNGFIKEELKND